METEPRHPTVAYDFFSQSDMRSSPSTNYSPYISSYYNEGANIGLHSEEVQSHQHQLHFHHQQQQLQHHHRSSHQQHCYHNQTIPSASSVFLDSQVTDQQSRQCDVIQLHWTSSSTHHLSLSQNSGSQYGAQAATLNYDQDYMTTNIQSVNHNDNFVEQSHVLLASGNGREDITLANCGEGNYHQHLYTGMTTTLSDGAQYSYGYYDHPFHSNHYQAPITGDRNFQEEPIKDDGYQYHQAPKLQTTSSLQELVSRKSENTSGVENVGAKTWQSASINQSDNNNQVETCQQSSSDLFIAQLHNNKDERSSFKDVPSWPSAGGGVAFAPTATTYSPSGLQITNYEPPAWHPSRTQPIKEQESAPVSRPNNSFSRTASDVLKTTGSSKNLTSRPAAAAVAATSSDGQTLVNLVAMRRRNQCHVCGRNYARPSTLKTHLRTHTNERPFKCNVCLKTFSQAANLTAHQRVHTGERPFSCPICGRQFSQSSSVITHLRTHSGERPYRCINCERTFSDSSTLTKHCRIHSGEKPYQCEYCPLNFSQSGNLSRHLKLHLISSSANVGGGTTSTPVGSASTSLTTNCNIMTPLSTSNRSSSSHSAFSLSSLSSSSSSISSSNEAAPAVSDQCYITSQKVQ